MLCLNENSIVPIKTISNVIHICFNFKTWSLEFQLPFIMFDDIFFCSTNHILIYDTRLISFTFFFSKFYIYFHLTYSPTLSFILYSSHKLQKRMKMRVNLRFQWKIWENNWFLLYGNGWIYSWNWSMRIPVKCKRAQNLVTSYILVNPKFRWIPLLLCVHMKCISCC